MKQFYRTRLCLNMSKFERLIDSHAPKAFAMIANLLLYFSKSFCASFKSITILSYFSASSYVAFFA